MCIETLKLILKTKHKKTSMHGRGTIGLSLAYVTLKDNIITEMLNHNKLLKSNLHTHIHIDYNVSSTDTEQK